MKRLALTLLFALSMWGQSLITITGPVKNADGSTFAGTVTITNPAMRCAGTTIPSGAQTVTITAGEPASTLRLYPTDGCNAPNGYYSVRYRSTSTGATGYGYWRIPASPSTQSIDSFETQTSPALTVAASQITGLTTLLDAKEDILVTQYGVRVGNGTANDIRLLPDCSDGTTGKLLYSRTTGFSCGADQTGAGGSGITSLGGQTGSTQTFSNDTNLQVSSSGNVHTLTWAGTLALARLVGGATGTVLAGNGAGSAPSYQSAPAISAANMTSFPTLNQTTTGTAAGLTAAYIDWNASTGGASILNKPALGSMSVLDNPLTTAGDILVASAGGALSRLAAAVTGNVLISGGVGTAPSWSKVDLTLHVSGTLPVANGGTGAASLSGLLKGNGTSPFSAAAYSDVASLWASGSCGTNYMKGDGTCDTGGGGGAGLPSMTGNSGKLLTNDGSSASWELQQAGSGISITQTTGTKTWGVDSTVVPFLALNNAFLGNNAFAGTYALTPSATQTLIATDAITVGTSATKQISSAGDITLTSTPTIAAGTDGQIVYLHNVGSFSIVIQDNGTLAGSLISLFSGSTLTLAAGQQVMLQYSTTGGKWYQVGGGSYTLPAPTTTVLGGVKRNTGTAGQYVSGIDTDGSLLYGTPAGGGAAFQRDFPAAVCQSAAGSLAWNTLTSDTPTPDCVIGANGGVYGVAKFSNSSTQAMQQSLDLPSSVTSITFDFSWRAAAAGGDVVWQVRYLVLAADGTASDDPDITGSGTTAAATAVTAATGVLKKSTITISPASAGGKRLYFRVFRDNAATGDTFTDATYTPELAKVTVTVQ